MHAKQCFDVNLQSIEFPIEILVALTILPSIPPDIMKQQRVIRNTPFSCPD